jgi:putative ABC transport system substrate-binding protein
LRPASARLLSTLEQLRKKILDGINPADLPVEQPTLIEMSINLKTAQVLGIKIPDAISARAERVIE